MKRFGVAGLVIEMTSMSHGRSLFNRSNNYHTFASTPLNLMFVFFTLLLFVGLTSAATYYKTQPNQCGWWQRSTATCTNYNPNYCAAGYYYSGTTTCATGNPSSCTASTRSASCGGNTICGKCVGGADTCGTAACGDIYGCSGTNVCNGLGTGAGNCVAQGGTGATCYCNAMCTSGVCTGNVCQAKYQSGTNLCGYYTGSSSSCDAANNYCSTGTYYPTQACSATPTYTSCQAVSSSASCAICGNCTGGSDTCAAAVCGTSNNYGCSQVCSGQGTGAGNCVAQGGTGATCYCNAMCTSGVCTGNVCQPYIQSGTNLCGYYNGTSASCGAANTFCLVGYYFPTQVCSATPTYTSCQAVSSSASCAICGNCTGGSDTCAAAVCGATNNYGCANMCAGNTTGSSACITSSSLPIGASCLCNAVCQSGTCYGGVCSVIPFIDITLNYPQHNTWNTSQTIVHSYTPKIENGTYDNCSLFTNKTGSWAYAAANATPITNNSANTITYNWGADYNDVRWNVYCYNTTGSFYNYSVNNFTLKIDSTPPSQVTGLQNNSVGLTWVNISWNQANDGPTGPTTFSDSSACDPGGSCSCNSGNEYCDVPLECELAGNCHEDGCYSRSNAVNTSHTCIIGHEHSCACSTNQCKGGICICERAAGTCNFQCNPGWYDCDGVASNGCEAQVCGTGSGISKYLIWRNGTNVANTTSLSYNDTGLTPETSYNYTVGAVDVAGNFGQNSTSLVVNTTSVPSLSFTITIPGNASGTNYTSMNSLPGTQTIGINFTITGAQQKNVNPCVGITSTCQDSVNPIFRFWNTGNVDEAWAMNLSALPQTSLTLWANSSGNSTPFVFQSSEALSWIVNNSIPYTSGNNWVDAWLYVNATGATPSTADRNLTHSSSYCGDLVCGGAENCNNCPGDCGGDCCGNEICDAEENCNNCPGDCGCGGGTACCYCEIPDWYYCLTPGCGECPAK